MNVHGRRPSISGARSRVSSPPIGTGSRQSSEIACTHRLCPGPWWWFCLSSMIFVFTLDTWAAMEWTLSRTLADSSRSPRVTGMASSETRGGSIDDYDDDDMDQQEGLSTYN